MPKKTKTPKAPDKLAKTAKKSGTELSEAQLSQATGGLRPRE